MDKKSRDAKEEIKKAIWRTGAFAGAFGDPYLSKTVLEGGYTWPTVEVVLRTLRAMYKDPSDLTNFSPGESRSFLLRLIKAFTTTACISRYSKMAQDSEMVRA